MARYASGWRPNLKTRRHPAFAARMIGRLSLAIVCIAVLGGTSTASAEGPDATAAGGTPTRSIASTDISGSPANAATLSSSIRDSLGAYGDPGGIHAFLGSKGIDYSFTYISEVLGNTSGGVQRGKTYEGRLDGQMDVDLEKLAGLRGLTLHANFYQNHGRGLTGNNLNDLFIVSNIEAYPSTKLYEAWAEQTFADGKVAVRVGQIGADIEFFVSPTANVFINSAFGAPAALGDNLPSNGPTYPLAAPAVRLKIKPAENVTLLAALFDGDPAGPYKPGVNNFLPQIRDFSGTSFRLRDPPLLITEAAFAHSSALSGESLPGLVKVGYLHHFGAFDATDVPGALGVKYRGHDSIYGIIDQTLYRVPGTENQGASAFLRLVAAPGDRNLFDLYADGGVAYEGLIPGRPTDIIGVSFAYARVSPAVSRLDALFNAPLVRDYQAIIEATYLALVVPGLSVQPEIQYILHPGAHGVANPTTGRPITNAAVFGLRTTIQY